MATSDVVICTSGDSGDGCGGRFPLKIFPGLCFKCKLLAKTDNDEQNAKIMAWKQCPCCGRTWKNFNPGQNDRGLCGGCLDSAAMPPPAVPSSAKPTTHPETQNDEQDLINTAVQGSKSARAHAMECRMNKQPNQDAPSKLPSTDTTDGSVFIVFEARIRRVAKSGKVPPVDGDIGKWGKSYAKSKFMSEILESEITDGHVTRHWDRREGMSLIPEEASLRWQGNFSLPPGSDSMTLGQVTRLCTLGDYATICAGAVSKESKKNANGGKSLTRIPLEVYIDKIAFDERKQLAGYASGTTQMRTKASRKRSGTESNAPGLEKRRAGESSGFVRSQVPRHGSGPKMVQVSFVRAAVALAQATGEVLITWPMGVEVQEGVISEEKFAEGATKYVYSLVIGSELYVAKRFFDVGTEGTPDARENRACLELELTRLEILRWFLGKFFRALRQKGVEHDANMSVVDAFLIRESGDVSVASGLGEEEFGEAVWLIEPRRPQSVRKFCGTLAHPSAKDKTAITVSSLLHYIFDESGKELVFADIQGSRAMVRGVETLILFDPMTHTCDGDSGVGDHGDQGIDAFVSQHRCTYVCKGLGLPPLSEEGAFVLDDNDSD